VRTQAGSVAHAHTHTHTHTWALAGRYHKTQLSLCGDGDHVSLSFIELQTLNTELCLTTTHQMALYWIVLILLCCGKSAVFVNMFYVLTLIVR